MSKRPLIAIGATPLLLGAAAAILFFSQGGFGGGHGHFDHVIGILGLPGILVVDRLPLTGFVIHSDLLLIILLPTILNCVLVWIILFAVAKARHAK